MNRNRLFATLLLIGLLALALPGEGKLSGLMIGDYYNVIAHHDEAIEGGNGFWLRRVYFTYDNALTDRVAMRFRLEMNSPGDFKTASTLVPFVKDAYLSHAFGRHVLMLGLIGTQMYSKLEDFWGYRAMEKTPIDLFKFGSSRDLGLSLQGALGRRGKVTYSLAFGNGSGTKAETNRGKAAYVRLNYQPARAFFVEIYADYTDTGTESSASNLQAFAGIKGAWGRGGLNFALHRSRLAGADSDIRFVSAFAVIKAGAKIDLVGRYDRLLDPNPNGGKIDYIPMADNAKANVVLAGLGWSPSKSFQVIPNLKYVFYDAPAGGERPPADFYAYLTLYFKF